MNPAHLSGPTSSPYPCSSYSVVRLRQDITNRWRSGHSFVLLPTPFPLPGQLPALPPGSPCLSPLKVWLTRLSQVPLPPFSWLSSLLLPLCSQTPLYTHQSEHLSCHLTRCRFLHGLWLSDPLCLEECLEHRENRKVYE